MIWLNGERFSDDHAVVSVYDSAMMYGDSVFEMLRTFNHQHFKADEHLLRLCRSAQTLGLPVPKNLPLALPLDEAHFRMDDEIRTLVTIGRGLLPLYTTDPAPWMMICQYPLRWVLRGKSALYHTGVHAITASIRQIPQDCIPAHIKHHNRIHFRLAEMEVQQHDPTAWALLLNRDATIAEATGANLFIVQRGELLTPSEGCLPGISRDFVLALARSLGVPARLDHVTESMMRHAGEAFFTCTPFSIVPCTRFNGRPIGAGTVGPITARLTQAWIEHVNCDFVAQAERWDECSHAV